MKSLNKLIPVLFVATILYACDNDKVEAGDPVVKDNVSFVLDIQPILTSKCASCHNPDEVAPDFRIDYAYASIEELIEEGDIIPNDANESEFVEMLEWRSEDGNNMPPSSPISPLNIALIKKWIDEGAKDN